MGLHESNGNSGHHQTGQSSTPINSADHFVQFYESDDFILNSISQFVATGLQQEDGAIVAARDSRLEGLERVLTSRGIDLAAATLSGQYVPIKGEEILSYLVIGDRVSETRFIDLLGGKLARLTSGGRQVRVFGELVSLLCESGNVEGALHLEQLWNDLQHSHPFSLFCAYPARQFARRDLHDAFQRVCTSHSRVIPAESFTSLSLPEDQLREVALLQQKAQALEFEVNQRAKIEEHLRAALSREQIARTEAETANRMKDEFLATVSHELRTPLNAIIGWTHMLRRSRLDDDTKSRALETIERNAKSQAQLVEDILDVSRMISGKLRLKVALVDTALVINNAVDAVQLAANSKGIELQVTLDPAARHVLGDANRLQQVVWNLLSNAIKFTSTGGRVTVVLERAGAFTQIKVTDNGQGIGKDFLPYVFDQFRQADGGCTRRHGGLGLGLTLVRHLVELHGGKIRASSAGEGMGATFIIELPQAPVPHDGLSGEPINLQSTSQSDAPVNTDPPLLGRRVLIVDDDTDTRQMLTVMLGQRRAEVKTASSAREALEILTWYQPHVLVLDLAMPGEDGYSLIEKIRTQQEANGRFTPAVALTAQVRIEDRARALSAGFDMFVPKPVEADELITAINNLSEAASA